jgi:hypothetical protein
LIDYAANMLGVGLFALVVNLRQRRDQVPTV